MKNNEIQHLILNSISESVILLDKNLQIKFVSPNIHNIFGYNYKEFEENENINFVLGDNFIDYELLCDVGEINNIEKIITDKYNNNRKISVKLKKVDYDDIKILAIFKHLTDIHDFSKKLQKQSYVGYDNVKKGEVYLADYKISRMIKDTLNEKYKNIIFLRRNVPKNTLVSDTVKYIGLNIYNDEELFCDVIKNLMYQMNQMKSGVIYLQSISYLYQMYGFDNLLKFIYEIEKQIRFRDFFLIVEIEDMAKQKNEVEQLLENFSMLDVTSFISITKKEREIIKFLKDATSIVNMNVLSEALGVSRLTARKYLSNLVDVDFVSINQKSRDKNLELTRDGMYYYQKYIE